MRNIIEFIKRFIQELMSNNKKNTEEKKMSKENIVWTRDDMLMHGRFEWDKQPAAIQQNITETLRRLNALEADLPSHLRGHRKITDGLRDNANNVRIYKVKFENNQFPFNKPGAVWDANKIPMSAHLAGQAADLFDGAIVPRAGLTREQVLTYTDSTGGGLGKFLESQEGRALLVKHDLYMEAPAFTMGRNTHWCHLGIRRPGSGNRVFNP